MRQFAIMTVVWGVVGMLVGVIIAAQLAWPELNSGHSLAQLWPIAPIAHQRGDFCVWWLRLVCDVLLRGAAYLPGSSVLVTSWPHSPSGVGNWLFCAAAMSLPLGYTPGKEYAELEWPIDILITVVWVAYAIVFFGTIGTRKVKHIYVANWFFGAFILAVALLHLVNSAEIPVRLS